MADNIIGNGSLRTPVISGSLSLSYSDLYLLTDQGATSSGISLAGETVYIEADLSNRLNIADIRFYLTSATSSGVIIGNLNFAYKNYEEDNYIYLDKNYNTQYFYADNLIQDFSPRYIRFDINSTTCELIEFEIYANDDIVNFGSDGLQTEYIIGDIPAGSYSTIQIYNNHATIVANAYAAIEYTGEVSDGYIELYNPQTLTFYNINDGAILKDVASSSIYKWYQGTYNYTVEENNKIILSDVNSNGFKFNPDDKDANINISNNGRTITNTSSAWGSSRTYGSLNHGKFYFEVKIDNRSNGMMVGIGLSQANVNWYPGYDYYSLGYYSNNGQKYYNGNTYSFGNTYITGDVIGVAMNIDTGKIWFSKNGLWQGSGDPDNELNPAFEYNQFIQAPIYPMIGLLDVNDTITLRVENVDFDYSTPSGFNALSDAVARVGTYITPIFTFDDQYASSYLITNTTTTSGISNIGTDLNLSTIEIRSSNTEPIPLDEVYWISNNKPPNQISNKLNFDRYVYYTDTDDNDWISKINYTGTAYVKLCATTVNQKNSHVIQHWRLITTYTNRAYFRIINRNNDNETVYYDYIDGTKYAFDGGIECNYYGSIWGYSTINGVLALTDYSSGSMIVVYELDLDYDFISNFSAELTGAGVWYTDKTTNSLVHKDGAGNTLLEDTTMTTPRAVCSTSDNGCWVVDNYDYSLRRYNFDGEIIVTGNLHREASKMINDGEDGFIYISNDFIYHVLNTGESGMSAQVNAPTSILNGNNIIIVYSDDNNLITIIDRISGSIVETVNMRDDYHCLPGIYMVNQTTYTESTSNVLPLDYDPVWGVSGTLEWNTVKNNEYILPKRHYHQVRTTLTTSDYTISPSLNSIAIPPAVKVQDIQPQDSRPLYVRTNFENGANMQDYITNLRVWWAI